MSEWSLRKKKDGKESKREERVNEGYDEWCDWKEREKRWKSNDGSTSYQSNYFEFSASNCFQSCSTEYGNSQN